MAAAARGEGAAEADPATRIGVKSVYLVAERVAASKLCNPYRGMAPQYHLMFLFLSQG